MAVLCFAHVTNQMGQAGDFEKGEANGAVAPHSLVRAVAEAWRGAKVDGVGPKLDHHRV